MQIFLQYCYSTILYIELYCSQNCKKKLILYSSYFSWNFSLIPLIFSVLFSLFLLFLHLLSPLRSFIAKISHPSLKFLTHLTRPLPHLSSHGLPLSHCTGAGFWIFEVGGWISVDRRAGFGSLGWDRLIGGFEMVDPLIGG